MYAIRLLSDMKQFKHPFCNLNELKEQIHDRMNEQKEIELSMHEYAIYKHLLRKSKQNAYKYNPSLLYCKPKNFQGYRIKVTDNRTPNIVQVMNEFEQSLDRIAERNNTAPPPDNLPTIQTERATYYPERGLTVYHSEQLFKGTQSDYITEQLQSCNHLYTKDRDTTRGYKCIFCNDKYTPPN